MTARGQIEGMVANDNGQGIFPFAFAESEVQIPAEEVDEVIKIVQTILHDRGVRLERTDDAIRLVRSLEEGSAYTDIGY